MHLLSLQEQTVNPEQRYEAYLANNNFLYIGGLQIGCFFNERQRVGEGVSETVA